jgi:hypothetical protein
MPARIMISAPEGGGKTETALRLARALAGAGGRILFIDTERRKALLYADRHNFEHLPWAAPYSPDELAEDVLAAGLHYDVIIIDSVYHFWSEAGGVRDIADRSAPSRRNKFAGWKDARPCHRRMVDGILGTRAHVILCCRAKVDYVQEPDPDKPGYQRVRSLGMQPMTDDFFPSEVDVHLRMDADTHEIHVAKSRIETIPQGTTYAGDDAHDIGETYGEWCQGGEPIADADDVAEIEAALAALPDDDDYRYVAGQQFETTIGQPRYLRVSQIDDARALVARLRADAPTPAPPALAPNPARLAAWTAIGPRLPQLLGAELEPFRTWMQSPEAKKAGARWKPTSAAGLDAAIDAAQAHYRKGHGGPRPWTDSELTDMRRALDDLRATPAEWAKFEDVAFENLADTDPETWTEDQFLALSTWVGIGQPAPAPAEQPDAHAA